MKFVRFTGTNGKSVWIAPSWIIKVEHPPIGYAAEANAVLLLSSGVQAVKEHPEDVLRLLESA